MKQTRTNGSATIGTTEYSVAAVSTTLAAQTDSCDLEVWLDLGAMAAGDQFRFRLYEKINGGTQRVAFDAYFNNAQPGPFISPRFQVGDGWDATVQKIAGTDRAIPWSLRKLVEGETVIVSSGSITSIQSGLATSAGLTSATSGLATASGVTSATSPLATSAGLTSATSPLATAAGLTSAVAPLATAAGLTTATSGLATSSGLTTATSGLATASGLTSAISPLATAAGLTSAVSPLATSAGVTSAVAPLATSAGLSSAVASLATAAALATVSTAVAALPTASAIVTAVLAGVVDGSKTVKGVLSRMNALLVGKATGLKGTVATFYKVDGTTVSFQATQDTALGTRVAASVAVGD